MTSSELYDKSAVKCVGNALDLSESADLVYNSGKVGLSAALLVLACEELAKGQHYRSMADGATTVDPSKLGETWVYSPKILYEHELKHMFSGAGAIVGPVIDILKENKAEIDSMMESIGMFEDNISINSPEFQEKIKKVYEKFIGSNAELQKKSNETRNLMERMESIKECGLYVDIRGEKVVSPRDITKDDYLLLRNHFDEIFDSFGGGIAGTSISKFNEPSKRYLNILAKKQTRPSMDKYRRGSLSKKKVSNYNSKKK